MSLNNKIMQEISDIQTSIETLKNEIQTMSIKPASKSENPMNIHYVEDDSVTEPTMVVYIPSTMKTDVALTSDVPRGSAVTPGVVGAPSGTNCFKVGSYTNTSIRNIYNYTAAMQSDGNLVIYNPSGAPTWASNTSGNPGAILYVQSDGNVIIYNSARTRVLWATNVFNFPKSWATHLLMDYDGKLKVITYTPADTKTKPHTPADWGERIYWQS